MNQIWLRHPNGNGRIFGNDAEADATSYLDRDSSIGDSVDVSDSRLYNSRASDNALISRASIWDSSIIDKCKVIGGERGIVIVDSLLAGKTRVYGNATLHDVSLRNVFVFGDAVLEGGWNADEHLRIHRGTWSRPPRYKVIEGENIRVVLSECTDDHFHLACWCLPRATWFRKGYRQRLGARSGWTPAQIEFAFDTFSAWAG